MNFFKPEKRYNISLQSPSKSLWSTFKKAYLDQKNFKSFWNKLDKKNIPTDLKNATEIFVNSPSYSLVSKFWRHCSINNFKDLSEPDNKDTQKSIINRDYTSYTLFNESNFKEINLSKLKDKNLKFDILKKHNKLSFYESISYNLVTALYFLQLKSSIDNYYEQTNKRFYENFSHELNINGMDVNQHLLYSLAEIEKIDKLMSNKSENFNILEFGAGYGRTGNLLFSVKRNVKYVIVDIPPSFHISTLQFNKYHPNLKINHAFEVKNKNLMQEIIIKNDITYIFPHQLSLLDEDFFDLSIMSGVTLEMEPKDVKYYMNYVGKLSKNLYMKTFKYSGLPFSFYKVYRYNVRDDYFIPKSWKEIFLDIGIETDFFCHYGYKIK